MRSSSRGRIELVVATCVGCGLAHIGTSTMPFQVGALMEGSHFTAGLAGLFGFFEVAALALSMVLVSPFTGRIDPPRLALIGCLAAGAGNGLAFVLHAALALMAAAGLAGAGLGLVFAATVAGAAASPEPDRLYAIGNSGALLIIVGVMASIPLLAHVLGPMGVFGAVALLSLASAPLLLGLRRTGVAAVVHARAERIRGAPGLLFSWAAFSCGTAALWAFSERIGRHIGLGPVAIASVLSASTFVGLGGTAVAAAFGTRLNRRFALLSGLGGCGLACLVLGFATGLPSFAAGAFLYWIFYMFVYSYLLGTAALLDPSGALGTLGGGCERLAYALGAWLGGVAAGHASVSATGVLGFLGCAAAAVLGVPSVVAAVRGRTGALVAPAGAALP